MIDHNYLADQFSDKDAILASIKTVVERGDFTLGKELAQFEESFAELAGTKHAVGVANGTDALFLLLKYLEPGEIITTPFTFPATVSAIVAAGHKPVFVDVRHDFNIDPMKIEDAITKDTKAILPVHWAGRPCAMDTLWQLASRHSLYIIEDACQAVCATYRNFKAGSMGLGAAFSLHPLKNLNIWGDGGVITTNSDFLAPWLRKARNHGQLNRDTVEFWGWNSRLDTIQAAVGLHGIGKLPGITEARRRNAQALNEALAGIREIEAPRDPEYVRPAFHIYPIHACRRRDELVAFLRESGVDAKIHYPTPLHLQPAAKSLGHKPGDFPMAEWCAATTLSLPVHEFVTETDIAKMADLIRGFYAGR